MYKLISLILDSLQEHSASECHWPQALADFFSTAFACRGYRMRMCTLFLSFRMLELHSFLLFCY